MGTTRLRDETLASAFDKAAHSYDRLVAVNPGYHRHLRRSARRLSLPHGGAGQHVLDLGCGTGASTRALLRVSPGARITAVDASAGMLWRAAAKRWPSGVQFVHSPAEALLDAGLPGPFDAVFAAYLVRNLTDPSRVLGEVWRLLRPGGRLAVHEYALSGARRHRVVWEAMCRGVIIPAGSCTAGGPGLYRHLHRSVVEFDAAPVFARRLEQVGFDQVRVLPMSGWQRGIVHTFTARRPAVTPGG
jgi:ubiquinone/menaquinone biosynthesis C-methylase UbiE